MSSHKCPKCPDNFPTFDKLTQHIIKRHPDYVAHLKRAQQGQRRGR